MVDGADGGGSAGEGADPRLLRAAVVHANDAVVITEARLLDAPGPRIVFVNDAFTRLTGYSAADVVGRSPRLLQGPRTSRATLDRLRAALGRWEPVTVELVNYRKDGAEYVVENSIMPVDDGAGWFTHFVSIQRDVTARHRDEAALRASEERFRQAFEEGPLGTALLDGDERFISANRRLCALLGRSADELQGLTLLDVTHPEDQDLHARGALALHRGDVPSYTVERRAMRAGGGVVWLRMTATTVRDGDGDERILAMFENTTAQRDDRAALVDARDRAEGAARARTRFLSNVTHELRTPLNAVLGFAQVLLRESAGPLLPKQREYTQHILDSGHHMLRLVNDLLDLRRVEDAREPFAMAAVPLRPSVERAATMVRPTCEARGIALELALPEALPTVRADPDAVVQVLANLLANAAGFTPADGTGRVVVRARDEGARVRVEVEDNGVGIAPEDHERIFEWFEQAGAPRDRSRKGTGIGLALTRAMVRRMGGEVALSSALGAGSTFSFTLLPAEASS
jgi:PAS domain S-box-containing protein